MQPQDITKVSISALVISLPIIYVSLLRVPPSTLARDSTFWFLMSNSIIAIIAADSGMLFLGSASHHDEDDALSDFVAGEQPTATVLQEDSYRDPTLVPLLPSSHEPTAPVDISGVVVGGGEQLLPIGGAASSKAADGAGMEEGHVLALIEGEGAAGKPSTDMVVNHAPVLQRCEEALELEPISTFLKGDQWIVPPVPRITVTPDPLPDDDVPQDEVKPRSSVAEESKPPRPEEEREYWQLSDEELNRKVEEFIIRFNRDMIEQEAAAF